jgi:hypothetical protein
LAKLFEARGFSGVLMGFPLTDQDEKFKPDALILTKNVILIVDFKNFDNRIVKLPAESMFKSSPWISREVEMRTRMPDTASVLGGSSINPFVQLQSQALRLKRLLPSSFSETPVQTSVLFQGEVIVDGVIPGKYQRHFSIASNSNYLQVFEDSLSLASQTGELPVKQISALFKTKPYTDVIPIDIDSQARLAELHTLWERESLAKSRVDAELLQARLEIDSQAAITGARSAELLSKVKKLEMLVEEAQTKYDKAQAEFQLEKDNEQVRVRTAIELARHESAKAKAESSKAREERQKVEAQLKLENAKTINKAIGLSSGLKWTLAAVGASVVFALFSFGPAMSPVDNEECVTSNFAAEHTDKNVCIEFIPKDVNSSNGRTYLNTTFEGFYVYIGEPESLYPGVDLEQMFEGKPIRVTGIVEERKKSDGSPRYSISVESQSQIQIVE